MNPKESKDKSMFTYICPECQEKVKGKKDIKILCGECDCEFEIKE